MQLLGYRLYVSVYVYILYVHITYVHKIYNNHLRWKRGFILFVNLFLYILFAISLHYQFLKNKAILCTFLDCGRKPEHLHKPCAGSRLYNTTQLSKCQFVVQYAVPYDIMTGIWLKNIYINNPDISFPFVFLCNKTTLQTGTNSTIHCGGAIKCYLIFTLM